MPVHSVRLDHLVLLNVDVNDTGTSHPATILICEDLMPSPPRLQAKRICHHQH